MSKPEAGACPDVVIVHASSVGDGGVVNAVLFYALALQANGYRSEIWTASKGLAGKARLLDVPVFEHGAFDGAVSTVPHPAVIARARAVRTSLRAVLHQEDKAWTFGRTWLDGVPEYVVFHNRRPALRHWFRNWLALSSPHARDLETRNDERGWNRHVGVIRNGPLPCVSKSCRTRRGDGITTIGAIGDFSPAKGMDVLLQAFARLKDSRTRLILAGDGTERARCRDLACRLGVAERVSWPGWIRGTADFYAGIEVFCSPSLSEAFGIILVEAMQAGLPVVASASDGARDIVVNGVTGWVVPTGDVGALAAALQAAIEDPDRSAALGAAGLARYRDLYTPRAAGRALCAALALETRAAETPAQ